MTSGSIPADCLCDGRENSRPFAKISECRSTESFICNSFCLEPELLLIDQEDDDAVPFARGTARSFGRTAVGRTTSESQLAVLGLQGRGAQEKMHWVGN
jgi:hypothetical protein